MLLIAQGPNPADTWRRPLPPDGHDRPRTRPGGLERPVGAVPRPPARRTDAADRSAQGPPAGDRRQPDLPRRQAGATRSNSARRLVRHRPHGLHPRRPIHARTSRRRDTRGPAPDRDAHRDAPRTRPVRVPRRPAPARRAQQAARRDLQRLRRPRPVRAALRHAPGRHSPGRRGRARHARRRCCTGTAGSAGEGAFEPSRRLIAEAVEKQKQTVLHVWSAARPGATTDRFTMQRPVRLGVLHAGRRRGVPRLGDLRRGPVRAAPTRSTLLAPWESNELRDDVKFAELVADILGALRQVQVLRERQGVFRRFFSPGVMNLLSGQRRGARARPARDRRDGAVLRPARLLEDGRGGRRELARRCCNRVSAALGVMTQNILRYRGAIADFLGDAALGFWGWPIDHPGKAEDACRAALGIRADLRGDRQGPGAPAVRLPRRHRHRLRPGGRRRHRHARSRRR